MGVSGVALLILSSSQWGPPGGQATESPLGHHGGTSDTRDSQAGPRPTQHSLLLLLCSQVAVCATECRL